MDPMERRFDLVVVGGGPAGVTAALRAAELGAAVALVERTRLGGTCTDDGCAPTRVLAHAARLMRDARQHAAYGIASAEPRIDLAELLAGTQRTVYELHEKKQLLAHLERAGASVFEDAGDARFAGPHELAVGDDGVLRAERFILAGGGHARRLDLPGAELALTHGDVWSLRRLPRSIVIVGGASTGVQLASVFAAFGSEVTLLELAPRLVPSEDVDVSAELEAGLRAAGIDVQVAIGGLAAIEGQPGDIRLTYDAGDERVVAAEAVLLAVGWPGNVDELGLAAAGVAAERGYIRVDDTLRTSAPHIFAAGDITGRMMLVQSATYEGRVAAENAVRDAGLAARHAIVAHGGFTDPEYGAVGLTEAVARSAARDVVIGRVPYADLDRAVIDGRTDGFCKLVADRDQGTLIGAHVVGEQAVEVVQIAATAMAASMPIAGLAAVEFAYPTYTAIVGLAARQAVHALRLPEMEARAWEELGRPRIAEWERREP
jgi:pyruvate/2-oxoglutarate dehydrogenase complex dihydrolipoamide dehydrogenase (E3) component